MTGSIVVLGAGSWGTALAWLLGRRGVPVTLSGRDPSQAAAIQAERRNARYLPELELPTCVAATDDVAAAVAGASVCVVAVPAQALRPLLETACSAMPGEAAVLIAAKGLEIATGMRPSEVALSVAGANLRGRLAILSGPNLAGEVVKEIPTTAVIASQNSELARELQALFSAPFFRVYTNPDVTGVELGGALKNPVAIAAGISDGLRFGNNTKAALITRGLAEMTRLGRACGADPVTFAGLSGLGDLVATCQSPMSRNYRLGVALGKGLALPEVLAGIGQVVEGVPTTAAACVLAERLGVEMPITGELRQVLYDGKPPLDGVTSLMSRAFRGEIAEHA